MPRLAALILAAGGSSRMGRPKQLLPYQNQPLVRRAALAALAVGCDPVTVVVGAQAGAVTKALEGLEVDGVTNAHWERGIGSSIRAGVARFTANSPDALLLMLCDQPLVTPVSLRRLIDAHAATHKPVCVSAYADTLGPPVLISASLFSDLKSLPDDRGAKVLWTSHSDRVCRVPCPEAATDVDTPADYAALELL
jgi:molybdenum cofactor cytidylyltransferase